MKTASALLLALLTAAQFGVLASLIQGRERILRHGEPFRFKTRPIDPADPFQGRYVSLGFDADHVPLKHGQSHDLRYRETLYATVASDRDGFAYFSGWSRERPRAGAYLKTRYLGGATRWDPAAGQTVQPGFRIDLPFSRFYMDEAKAPRAEQAARDATRGTNCWAAVRLLNGRAAVEDVFAKGQSLRELAAREPAP